jgi:hypothetical protein
LELQCMAAFQIEFETVLNLAARWAAWPFVPSCPRSGFDVERIFGLTAKMVVSRVNWCAGPCSWP